MKQIVDAVVYVIFRSLDSTRKSTDEVISDTRKILTATCVMSVTSSPMFLLFSFFPKAKDYLYSAGTFISLLSIVVPSLVALYLTIYFLNKTYDDEKILSVSKMYQYKLPKLIAKLITLILVLVSFSVLVVFSIGIASA